MRTCLMSQKNLEERVALLEQQVSRLLAQQFPEPGPMDWLKTVGMFSGNEAMKAMDAKILALRERERRRARARKPRRKRVAS